MYEMEGVQDSARVLSRDAIASLAKSGVVKKARRVDLVPGNVAAARLEAKAVHGIEREGLWSPKAEARYDAGMREDET